MPGRKRTFSCGHKGRGRYCHRCAEQQKKREHKRVWQETFAQDPVDLTILPTKSLVRKARTILKQIADGTPYTDFRGRRLNHDRTVVSVPINLDYRLLFRETGNGLVPIDCLSHEAYNVTKPGG